MVKGTVLIIETHHVQHPVFAAALRKKGLEVIECHSGKAALALMPESEAQAVILNAAALGSSGTRICQRLKNANPEMPLILILPPQTKPSGQNADVILNLPFTAQKIVNRLKHYLSEDNGKIIKAGILKIDAKNRRITCLDKEERLTPRLLRLLMVLVENRGKPVSREELFKKVWRTDYTEDTRTLDVHISWLRRALEPDPRHPRFLKTVRGIGYLLDI